MHIGENKRDLREDHKIVVQSDKIPQSANIDLRRIKCAVDSRRLIVNDDIGKRGVVRSTITTAQTSTPLKIESERLLIAISPRIARDPPLSAKCQL